MKSTCCLMSHNNKVVYFYKLIIQRSSFLPMGPFITTSIQSFCGFLAHALLDIRDIWPKRISMFPSNSSYLYYYRAMYNKHVGENVSYGKFSGTGMRAAISCRSPLRKRDKLEVIIDVLLCRFLSSCALILSLCHLIQMHFIMLSGAT